MVVKPYHASAGNQFAIHRQTIPGFGFIAVSPVARFTGFCGFPGSEVHRRQQRQQRPEAKGNYETTGPRDHGTTGPRTTGPRDYGTTGLRDHGTTGLRDYGTTGPRDYGTTDYGTTGLRDHGTTDYGTTRLRDHETTGPRDYGTTRLRDHETTGRERSSLGLRSEPEFTTQGLTVPIVEVEQLCGWPARLVSAGGCVRDRTGNGRRSAAGSCVIRFLKQDFGFDEGDEPIDLADFIQFGFFLGSQLIVLIPPQKFPASFRGLS